MAMLNPMILAETLTLAVVEILRLFSDRGVNKAQLDALHDKLVSAVQADQGAMETFIRTELATQIESLRAETNARHEALRRDVRQLVLVLGVTAAIVGAAAAALVGWLVRGA